MPTVALTRPRLRAARRICLATFFGIETRSVVLRPIVRWRRTGNSEWAPAFVPGSLILTEAQTSQTLVQQRTVVQTEGLPRRLRKWMRPAFTIGGLSALAPVRPPTAWPLVLGGGSTGGAGSTTSVCSLSALTLPGAGLSAVTRVRNVWPTSEPLRK